MMRRKIIKLIILIIIWLIAWSTLAIFCILFYSEKGIMPSEGRFIWTILSWILDCLIFWKGYKISTDE